MFVAIISFVGLAVSIVLAVRMLRGSEAKPARGAIFWSVVFMALQAFVGVWAAMGLVDNDVISAIVLNVVLCLCSWWSLRRDELADALHDLTTPDGRFPHPTAASVVILLVTGLLATLALEIPSNHNLAWMYPLCFVLEWGLISAALAGTYFLFQRRGMGPVVVTIICFVIGIAEYFVIKFKTMPITPGDLTALSTAAAVAGTGYEYSLTAYCLYGIALLALALFGCQLAGLMRPAKERRSRKGLLVNLLVGALCIVGIVGHVTIFDYHDDLNITVYTWRPLESYYRQGFIPTFISSCQTYIPSKPDGYDVDEAAELVEEYADEYDADTEDDEDLAAAQEQFDEEQPTVIVIMNETFSDLSIYEELHADYEGPTYFNSLSDCLLRGTLYVSAYGGGTANSEFEMLTGYSMAYLGSGVYPYTAYDLTDTDSLVSQFSDLGYYTVAMHPNHGTNWNRENAYEDLGFDEFLTIEDFEDADTLRGMVTDQATYEKILELIEESDDPLFCLDVTMQNHSGYTTGAIAGAGYSDDEGIVDDEVNEYLALIQESDEALEYFIEALRDLDEPVVVVFFGDHQPSFASEFNAAYYEDESGTADYVERQYQTSYFIWANYDVAGNSQTSEEEDLSTNYLGAVMMELIGGPLSDYQKAQLTLRESLTAINSVGYYDSDGTAYLLTVAEDYDESTSELSEAGEDAVSAYQDLWTMQYYSFFGDGKDILTKHVQSAANETDPNLDPGTTIIQ